MSLRNCVRTSLAIAALMLAANVASPAKAQVIIGRGGGGISVSVPGLGGIRLGAPVRVYGAPRRLVVGPYGVAPSYDYPYGYGSLDYPSSYGGVSRYAARPIGSGDYSTPLALPTEGELRAMDDSSLLNALVGLTDRLDADLNRFDTGDTWQRYLRLPEDALPPADDDGRVLLGRESLVETLKRFDRTVANPQYVQISGLPSYAAAHAALAEVVRRFGSESGDPAPVVQTRIPPAVPVPPEPSPPQLSNTDDFEPRSIEMRNLHAAPRSAEPANIQATDQSGVESGSGAEELPVPPPSLVAPQNDDGAERSILSD